MSRSFRFAIAQAGAGLKGPAPLHERWKKHVTEAEAAGYSGIFVSDSPSRSSLTALEALSFAAAITNRLRLGIYVLNMDFRNPILLAEQARTLDVLSEGRLEFGIGAGYGPEDYALLGIPYEPAGVRVSRFMQSVHTIKQHLAKRSSDMDEGSSVVEQYFPRILMGVGSRRMLKFAGQVADIVSISHAAGSSGSHDITFAVENLTDEPVREKLAWLQDGAGDRFEKIEIGNFVGSIIVTDNHRAEAKQRLANTIGTTVAMVEQSLGVLIGSVEEIVDTLEMRRERYGLSYIQIPSRCLEMFAPVVERLAGK